MATRAQVLALRLLQLLDRLRLRRLHARHPGLSIHPDASTNFAHARFDLRPGARLCIGPGVVTERRRHGVCFHVESGAEVVVEARTWLRSDLGPVYIAAFEGARMQIGPEGFLNGCHVSAKQSVVLRRRAWVGPGSRIFDSDQHDVDAARPEQSAPVTLGEHTWVASDVTVLKGVEIGAHSVIGARSVVTHSIDPHVFAVGAPAEPKGRVGDRSETR